jgi:DNA-binding MarR family transcriptional regulator
MSSSVDRDQLGFVREFLLFMGRQVKKCTDTQIRQCAEDREPCKMTNQEFALLFLLMEKGPMAVKDLASGLGNVSLSTLTRMLDKLEENGYLTRSLDRNDRRSFIIYPTEKSKELAGAFRQRVEGLAEAVLEGLTAAERLMLVELFAKIQTNLTKTSCAVPDQPTS